MLTLAGVAAAALAWIGWVTISPSLGFPDVQPAAMVGRLIDHDGSGWPGWVVLVLGLASLAGLYVLAGTRRAIRATVATGALYGVALWLLVGAVLMPLMGAIQPHQASSPAMMVAGAAAAPDAMRGTFMMLHLGPAAPLGALLAWLIFGSILGATTGVRRLRPTRRGAVGTGVP